MEGNAHSRKSFRSSISPRCKRRSASKQQEFSTSRRVLASSSEELRDARTSCEFMMEVSYHGRLATLCAGRRRTLQIDLGVEVGPDSRAQRNASLTLRTPCWARFAPRIETCAGSRQSKKRSIGQMTDWMTPRLDA